MTTKAERRKDNLEWGQLTPSGWSRPAPNENDTRVKRKRRAEQKRARASRKGNRSK